MTDMKTSALGPTTAGPTPSILSLVWTPVSGYCTSTGHNHSRALWEYQVQFRATKSRPYIYDPSLSGSHFG